MTPAEGIVSAPQTPRDVCLGVLDGAEAHDYGSGYGSPGVARIGSPQAAKITDDLLAALAEAGYVVVRPEAAAEAESFGAQLAREGIEEMRGRIAAEEVRKQVAEEIADAAEFEADELDLPTTLVEWLELRDWFKGKLHEVAAKAREIGGLV